MSKSFLDVLAASAAQPTLGISASAWANRQVKSGKSTLWTEFSGRSSTGKTVTVDSALQLSAVWACVRLISETLATLPLVLYKRKTDGGREPAKDHPLYELLRYQPNYDMTAVQWLEVGTAAMLLWGNTYNEKAYAGKTLSAINFMLPSKMKTKLRDDGGLEYAYTPKSKAEIVKDEDMFHIPAFSLDGRRGLSPISYGANVFGSAMSADDAAGSTFKNGMMPTVAYLVDRFLKKEQREEFRTYAASLTGALNAGKSPVLEAGMKPQMLGINPTDAQLLETRSFSVEEICRWYRVPPYMVGHTQNSTSWGTGMEQQMIGFLTFTLRPWLTRIEQSIRKSLLRPEERAEYYAEFNIEVLLRADSPARAAFYSSMTQNGIYTRDDCRVKENLPRMGGNAEVLTVQTNLSPLDQLGSAPNQMGALRSILGITDQNESAKFEQYIEGQPL